MKISLSVSINYAKIKFVVLLIHKLCIWLYILLEVKIINFENMNNIAPCLRA